jgi:esterase/lipase
LDARIANKSLLEEAETIIDVLKQALVCDGQEDGMVPQSHIDHIYQHIEGKCTDEEQGKWA